MFSMNKLTLCRGKTFSAVELVARVALRPSDDCSSVLVLKQCNKYVIQSIEIHNSHYV